MCESFVGSVISLDCGDALGTYQGHVSQVNKGEQSITISKAFRNGVRCQVPHITINASDIRELKILKNVEDAYTAKTETLTKNGHSEGRHENNNRLTPSSRNRNDSGNGNRLTPTRRENGHMVNGHRNQRHTPTKDEFTRRRHNSFSADSQNRDPANDRRKASTPKRIEGGRRRNQAREDCFSAPADNFLDEFDFEKNLALFDKQAVFEEIESTNPECIIKAGDKKATKYRCDENVLQSGPVVFKQISIPGADNKDYVTDSGLVVPSISFDLRCKLFNMAEKHGYLPGRQVEMVGRSAAEMVLQLVGGSHRLNPKNAHQRPSVVVLSGSHMQGAQAINCARHLANHDVDVTLFVPNFVKMMPLVTEELQMYELTDAKKTSNAKELPTSPIDMIITALDSHENPHLHSQAWYKAVVNWASSSKASALAIDPLRQGGPIAVKWSLSLGLPLHLSDRCGQVYLCEVGFPQKVFKDAGIKYKSPFSHKFCIPLHPKS